MPPYPSLVSLVNFLNVKGLIQVALSIIFLVYEKSEFSMEAIKSLIALRLSSTISTLSFTLPKLSLFHNYKLAFRIWIILIRTLFPKESMGGK